LAVISHKPSVPRPIRRGNMQAVGQPGLENSHAVDRANFHAQTAGRMRKLRFGREQKLLRIKKQCPAQIHEIAGTELLELGVAATLAVEELTVHIQPTDRVRS